MRPRKKNKSANILDTISPNDAFVILKILAKEDTNIAKRIEQLAIDYLGNVDIEDVAEEVYWELNGIEVEEVWDRSGSTRDGYIDPGDMAYEMFEEALEPFLNELKKCQKLSLFNQAKYHCMGILKGIYKFHKESTSEYKDWAVDAPCEYFDVVLKDWKNDCQKPEYLKEVKEFIKKNFPDWAN
ncbi:MAG: hypothetical protein HY999_04105 [Nitrospinae bacterium]|nr:hypothetical protein [Nitrospinota bacterium]